MLGWLEEGKTFPVWEGFFHLTLVYNRGIAFGLFQRHETLLFLFITASILALLILGGRLSSAGVLPRLGLILILGGAIGNWIDRIRCGAVIDFLDFRVWPVFNFADSAITVGVLLYAVLVFRQSRGDSPV